MAMTPTKKITMLVDAINQIKRITTQVEVGGICNRALNDLTSHARHRGPKLAVGRYSTREELVRGVLFFYYQTNQNQTQVARTTGVSQTTVHNIIEEHGKDRSNWI